MKTGNEIVAFYRRKHCKNLWKTSQWQLESWYWEAREVYRLEATFKVFSEHVLEHWTYKKGKRKPLTAKDRGPYSVRKKYEKKTLTEEEQRKREWRRKVKDPRDQDRNRRKRFECEIIINEPHKSTRKRWKQELAKRDFREYGGKYWEQNWDWDDEKREYVLRDSWDYNYCPNDWDDFVVTEPVSIYDYW